MAVTNFLNEDGRIRLQFFLVNTIINGKYVVNATLIPTLNFAIVVIFDVKKTEIFRRADRSKIVLNCLINDASALILYLEFFYN